MYRCLNLLSNLQTNRSNLITSGQLDILLQVTNKTNENSMYRPMYNVSVNGTLTFFIVSSDWNYFKILGYMFTSY